MKNGRKTGNTTRNAPTGPVTELLNLRKALFAAQKAALNISQHNVDEDTRTAIYNTKAALNFSLGITHYNELPDAVRVQAHV